jgi:catechol 2,3-dioxygenase-like lactoylglutathione lyase family enzyme
MLQNAVRPSANQIVCAVLVLLFVRTAGAQTVAPAGLVSGVGNFSHIVASLDRSVEFYRDVIGLAVDGPPRVFAGDAAMKVGNTPGAQSVFVALAVPGSAMGVEIIEYKDIDRTPAQPRFQDPGAANLILTVRDIDAIVARAKKAGVRINSSGGVPATIQGGNRVIFIQDPDGFFVELFQPARPPATAAPASSNVIGGGFEIMVADTDRTMRLYKEVLGFNPQVGTTFDGTKLLMDTAGTPGARFRRSAATIPGSSVTMAFLEFKDIDRKPLRTRFQDPGTPVLQLRTTDIDAVTKAWKAAGGEVVTAGGQPIDLGAIKLILFRDPNNLILEMISGR